MGNPDLNRDVRTLLFGKIAPAPHENGQQMKDHDGLYKQIYDLPPKDSRFASTDSACTFLTFGGYDAIRVYQPKLDAKDSKWLHKIYEDKQRIIQMPSNDIIYHQMHVVSQHSDTCEFWDAQRDDEYPFFLATLIYGVNVEGLDDSLTEYLSEHEIQNPDDVFLGSSKYEKMIRLHLDKYRKKWDDQVRYAIYNGITVADVVVLWRAKNLNAALKALRYIEYSGVARKTLTTLGFPIDADGRIKQCVTDNLIQNMDQSITVSIQGSVRDFRQYSHMQNLLTGPMPENTCADILKQCRELEEALNRISGGFAEELKRLNNELLVAVAPAEQKFTDKHMQKVRALEAEAKCLSKTLPTNIHSHVANLVRKAVDLSRNTVDRIRNRVDALVSEADHDPSARQKLYHALHNAETKKQLRECEGDENRGETYTEQICHLLPAIYAELCCGMHDHQWLQSLGKSDFTATGQISYANLANLLEIYRAHHEELSDACWEFLTDVKVDQPSPGDDDQWIDESKRPSNVLCKLYADFQALCPKVDEKNARRAHAQSPGDEHKLDLRQFPWFNALQELLGTHHYIDHHPVLHGPSYLVYTSLRIAYSYFAGLVPDYESQEDRTRLLKRSEENIIAFISNLDQLTEQISRNDDAMLNNRSNTHTIHFSLPESALEFYHAFLRRIVNFLIQFDEDAHLIPPGFEYDFLLSPKTCGSFRFRPMLRTEHKDHAYKAEKVWPQKQAYILELPLESIFNPIDIFIPFVHEAFHCFGDVLRRRPLRKEYMSLFVASNLLNVAGMARPEYRDFCAEIARLIYPTNRETHGPYLTSTWQQLIRKTEELLNEDTLGGLSRKFGGRVKDVTLVRWLSAKDRALEIDKNSSAFAERMTVADAILKNCHTYFKECYADAMTVALLQLTPEEYLKNSLDELRRFYYKYHSWEILDEADSRISVQRTHLAQRFAIVLATCHIIHSGDPENKLRAFTKKRCIAAIEGLGQPSAVPLYSDSVYIDEIVDYRDFSHVLRKSFDVLLDERASMSHMRTLHPPATLRYVIDYLLSTIELLYSKQTKLIIQEEPPQEYGCEELAKQFKTVIRQGNMFGEDFYKLIYNHHDEIRKAAQASLSTEAT